MKKPLLTIGMIFKNEIRCLERCMKSLEPLRKAISCELIMADTGSDDGSREIAEKYADIVFDFPWIDDFAAARNSVVDRSSGKWFMTLDADEWLDTDVEELINALRNPKETYYLLCVKIRNFQQPNVTNKYYNEFYALRIMRNGVGIRYEGTIHEYWKYPDSLSGKKRVWPLDTLVYHDGYAFSDKDVAQAKWDRNMNLLQKKLEEDPNNLHVLSQCIDSTQNKEAECMKYVHRALEVLHRNWDQWKYYGAKTYRDAVATAQLYKKPELLEWAEKAAELYPDSIFTRVDIAFTAFSRCWDSKDAEGAVRWATMYRKGIADYRSGHFNGVELIRGVLYFFSPSYERPLIVFLVKSYLDLRQYEDALSTFEEINGAELEEKDHVELCTYNLLELHRATERDTTELITRFWDQINQPVPTEEAAEMRRTVFMNIASYSLLPKYREDEVSRPGFKRRGYTALLPLEGKCVLGDAAAILEITDLDELTKRLAAHDLTKLPIAALSHALLCGMPFPLPGQKLKLEEMDALANRMVPFDKFLELSQALPMEEGNIQRLCWKRTLLLAGIRNCKWDNSERDMTLAKAFVEMERQFLPACYAQSVLTEEGSILLPPLHRFGWYCTKAFDALEAGNRTAYVRLLHQGLDACPDTNTMVAFLLKQLEESQRTPELLALADQVRMLLSQYPADDPAVEALKQSVAYQTVAHLIEGPDLGILGGLAQ